MVDRIRLFFDPTREPLRRRVYTALAAVVTFAVTAGLITASVGVAVTGVLSAVLIGAVAEQVRKLVTPYVPIDDSPGKHAEDRSL